ncbi:MAG TPA: ABC transporter ATP-binding protein [Anaerohalosphaeraceae bacterium]|nr:ABC transporter ATP-binding protein [Anaerohalosphaeraceae bacterium]HOL89399.1 ABC transporter ATP-binding protein [Anaerohalosphaeraceae bacterium]HPP55595.1 ABC transporter ATP-binding protein [Anaerohalosphaeraceae bacterium]
MQVLEAQRLRKEFGPLAAVQDVSFSMEQGQVVGLIGPNGAGKTTLLRMLATLLPPTDGTASIMGIDLCRHPLEIRRRIGYLPDFFNLYNDLTLWECLDFTARAYSVPSDQIPRKIDTVLEYVNLTDKKNDLCRHLSRGMVQRMGLAVLMVHEPDLYLLDEPASGLDPIARINLRNILKRLADEKKTILISSHILHELSEFCTHIAIMDQGQIRYFGSVEQIRELCMPERILRVRVLGDPQKVPAVLREFPNAAVKDICDTVIRLSVKGGLETAAQLNAFLVGHGVSVAELTEEKKDLEDLFLAISAKENVFS